MRVLFWSGTFWPQIGGIEVLATKVLPALRERGYEFIVVTQQNSSDIPAEAEYEGIPVYRFPFWNMLNDKNIDQLIAIRRKLVKLKRAFAPDLAHLNSVNSPCSFFYRTTANAHPTPTLVTLHDELPGSDVGRGSMMGHTLRSADWTTSVSTAVLDKTRQLVPEIIPCSSVIYNGTNLPELLPEPLPNDPPQLLCVGRLVFRKGFDVALRAFASIVDRYPHVRLVIAGDGSERPALEQQAMDLGCSKVVRFVGWIAPDRVPALMNTATVVLMPSRCEPFGLVALEAALMARPIVATRVGGLPEVVAHGQSGLLVENENSHALAEAVTFLLDHPQTAGQMGQAARSRAIERFSWDRCVDAYDALYRKLITGAREGATESTTSTPPVIRSIQSYDFSD